MEVVVQRKFVKIAVAAAVLVLVSAGSYEVAAANTSPAVVSRSAGIGACATAGGYLRLVDSSAHCPTGYTSIRVAQAATTAKDGSTTCASAEGSEGRTAATPLGDAVSTGCDVDLGFGDCAVTIDPAGAANVQIGGSVVATTTGDTSVGVKDRHNGSTTAISDGATAVEAPYGGNGAQFFADANDDSSSARLALHLVVSRPGDSFSVDAMLSCNSSQAVLQLQVTPSN